MRTGVNHLASLEIPALVPDAGGRTRLGWGARLGW
jgi:hypothetical protein